MYDLKSALIVYFSSTENTQKVAYAIKEGLSRLVNESGMSEAEYVRDVLMVHVLGVDAVIKIHEERIKRFAGMGQEKA